MVMLWVLPAVAPLEWKHSRQVECPAGYCLRHAFNCHQAQQYKAIQKHFHKSYQQSVHSSIAPALGTNGLLLQTYTFYRPCLPFSRSIFASLPSSDTSYSTPPPPTHTPPPPPPPPNRCVRLPWRRLSVRVVVTGPP